MKFEMVNATQFLLEVDPLEIQALQIYRHMLQDEEIVDLETLLSRLLQNEISYVYDCLNGYCGEVVEAMKGLDDGSNTDIAATAR